MFFLYLAIVDIMCIDFCSILKAAAVQPLTNLPWKATGGLLLWITLAQNYWSDLAILKTHSLYKSEKNMCNYHNNIIILQLLLVVFKCKKSGMLKKWQAFSLQLKLCRMQLKEGRKISRFWKVPVMIFSLDLMGYSSQELNKVSEKEKISYVAYWKVWASMYKL